MATERTTRYNYMDKVLQNVNEKYISLSQDEIKRNNEILHRLINDLIENMKENDVLFKTLYSRIFYGGSFYDGLKILNPNEYDLDLLLDLNRMNIQSTIAPNKFNGFVTIKVDDFYVNDEKKRKLQTLMNPQRLLDPKKVLSWMEGLLHVTLNKYPHSNGYYTIRQSDGEFNLKIEKSGPTLTIKLKANYRGKFVVMDIDLVTSFEYPACKWPKGFKRNATQRPNFFVVPKPRRPRRPNTNSSWRNRNGNTSRCVTTGQPLNRRRGNFKNLPLWRLSFQEQEQELVKNQKHLKPTIKLLKMLTHVQDHKCIASYYIKTVVLNLNDKIMNPQEFWRNSLSYVFMAALKEYQKCIENKNIPYYWKSQNNLINSVNPITLNNISNQLKAIIADIDRNIGNPEIILKYLIH